MYTDHADQVVELIAEWDVLQATLDIMGYMGTHVLVDRDDSRHVLIVADFGVGRAGRLRVRRGAEEQRPPRDAGLGASAARARRRRARLVALRRALPHRSLTSRFPLVPIGRCAPLKVPTWPAEGLRMGRLGRASGVFARWNGCAGHGCGGGAGGRHERGDRRIDLGHRRRRGGRHTTRQRLCERRTGRRAGRRHRPEGQLPDRRARPRHLRGAVRRLRQDAHLLRAVVPQPGRREVGRSGDGRRRRRHGPEDGATHRRRAEARRCVGGWDRRRHGREAARRRLGVRVADHRWWIGQHVDARRWHVHDRPAPAR